MAMPSVQTQLEQLRVLLERLIPLLEQVRDRIQEATDAE